MLSGDALNTKRGDITAEIKWVKLTTDMFDNRKIKQIRHLPEGNNIVLIWVMLLTIAGRCNASGMIFLTENIPYSIESLAVELDFDQTVVKLALDVLQKFGMIVCDESAFYISNWEEYQNIEGMELIREQNRLRKQAQRAREKALLAEDSEKSRDSHVTSQQSHATDIESERESEREVLTPSKEGVCRTKDVRRIIEAWNSLGLQQIQKITADSSRGKMLKARVAEYGVDEVLRAIEKVRSSDFLRGSKDFLITFEWFVKPNNFPKVLEGNYDNRGGKKECGTSNPFLRGLMKGIDDEEE